MRRRISCFRLLCWRGEPRRVGSSRPQSRSINERVYCLLRNLNDPIRRHRADSSAINPVSRHLTCPRHWTMFNSIYVSHPWWSRNDCFTFICRFSSAIILIFVLYHLPYTFAYFPPPVSQSVPIQVQLQRKKSLPDVQESVRQLGGGLMSREEVSVLGSARREEVRRQIETSERLKANPLLYLVSPQVKVQQKRTEEEVAAEVNVEGA